MLFKLIIELDTDEKEENAINNDFSEQVKDIAEKINDGYKGGQFWEMIDCSQDTK